MTKKARIADLPEFDLARQLRTEEDIAAYVTMVIADGDASELAHALGIAAGARGMNDIAQAAACYHEHRRVQHPGNFGIGCLYNRADSRVA